jgi:vanillate O-demethylase monooxygenase subunit
MYHGILFDATGQVTEILGQDLIPAQARVRNYLVWSAIAGSGHGWGSERADAAAIPATVGLDDPEYLLGHGQLDYEAEAKLINDNLLDFSHPTYVHENLSGLAMSLPRNCPK